MTLIGDSLSVGAIKQISNKLPGIDYEPRSYDGTEYQLIQVSKHLAQDVAGNASGITIAKQLKEHGDMRQYLLFALGTNDPGGVTKDTINKLVDAVGKDQKIILVTNASDGAAGAPNYNTNNQAIRDVASTKENIEVADWAKVVGDNAEGYISDSGGHVHLSDNGNKQYAQTLYDGVYKFSGSANNTGEGGGNKVSVGSTLVSGDSREEVIWNWLTTNIPSLTAEQKAAILGNAKAEMGSLDPFADNGTYLGIFQMRDERRSGLEALMHARGISSIGGTHSKEEIYAGISATLEYMFTKDSRAVSYLENLYRAQHLSGAEAVKAYSDMWLVHVEGAYDTGVSWAQPLAYKELTTWSPYFQSGARGQGLYQGATTREDLSVSFYEEFGNGTGSGTSGLICPPDGEIHDVDGYTFPIMGATKSNYLNPGGKLESVLSKLPCPSKSCHHDYPAADMGIDAVSVGITQDQNELKTGYSPMYYYSMGAKVVALTNGKITNYHPYSLAVGGYQDKCSSVTFTADDGTVFWLGHMSYDPEIAQKFRDGTHFNEGDVIGEIGPPQCAQGTQSHLHIQIGTNSGPGAPEVFTLMNKLYEALPNG